MNRVRVTKSTSAISSPLRRGVRMAAPWLFLIGVLAALPGHALDLVTFTGITGPLSGALTTIASLGPAIKALIGFISFVVAIIALASLRNFSPVLSFVGLAIFASVGLVAAGSIMGAVI
jgi:hypothetical protein